MQQRSYEVNGRTIAYTDWGDADNPSVLVCAHGLTRTSRDFDPLADALSDIYRVICPDAAGRGESAWMTNADGYTYVTYVADTSALLAEIGAAQIDWVGTSMGGLLGLMVAASPASPIRRMVMNDIGPHLPKEALQRIADYLTADKTFADLDAVEAYLRDVHAPFGALTDEQWRHMAVHSYRPAAGGGLSLHYDPAIVDAFNEAVGADVDLWDMWDSVNCPVLVVRGEASDLLPADTAREMTERGPKADLIEITGCGHAPALMDKAQIDIIRDWLTA